VVVFFVQLRIATHAAAAARRGRSRAAARDADAGGCGAHCALRPPLLITDEAAAAWEEGGG